MLQERRAGDPRRTDITGGTTTYFLLEEDETRTHIFVKRSEDGSIKSIVWERTTLDRYETKKTHTITNKDQNTLEKIARYMDMGKNCKRWLFEEALERIGATWTKKKEQLNYRTWNMKQMPKERYANNMAIYKHKIKNRG